MVTNEKITCTFTKVGPVFEQQALYTQR